MKVVAVLTHAWTVLVRIVVVRVIVVRDVVVQGVAAAVAAMQLT